MKKIIISSLAALSLVACVQEEVVTFNQSNAIAFENAFIDNATRAAADPSTTLDRENPLQGFDVWAFMDESNGTVFVDEDVTKFGNGWAYTNTQYWTPEHTYYFAALAPMNSANVTDFTAASGEAAKYGLGSFTFTNVDGSEDLLYAATTVNTPDYTTLQQDGMEAVKFHFSHLLSKVKFTFKNGFLTDNAYVVVSDIKMSAPKSASIDLAVENWWDNNDWQLGAETFELAFGGVEKLAMGQSNECTQERLTIPVSKDYDYEVTFTVQLYMGEVLALETTKTSAISGVALEMGKAYNFAAEINPDNLHLPSIEFEVEEVKDWVTATTPSVQVQQSELKAAAILGGSYTLENDVVVESPVVVPAGSHFVLNLNGQTLKNQVENADTDVIIVEEGATLVINGEGTVEAVSGNDGYAVVAKGKVTINGGTFKAGVDENGEANAVVYARGNGEVYVNGGFFPNAHNSAYVLNKRDADRATAVIEVKGGTFEGFDPANNAAENAGTNFCAEGYTSYKDGEYYVVVNGAVVETADEFKAAAANAALQYIIVAADLDFGTQYVTVGTSKVIVGNGYKFIAGGTKSSKNYALGIQKAVNVVINDLVMNGGGGIYVSGGANVEVNNVDLKVKYSASGRHMFYVNNATLTVNSGNYDMLNTGYKYFTMENNAKAYVNGGTFGDMQTTDTPTKILSGSTLVITGGKFQVNYTNYKFDPTPYLATGYKAVRVGDYMEVSAE